MKNILFFCFFFATWSLLAQPPVRVFRDIRRVPVETEPVKKVPATSTTIDPRMISVSSEKVSLVTVLAAKTPEVFEITASAANTQNHVVKIDNAFTNNNPNAIIFATQKYGVYNPNEIGVYYTNSGWAVFNQNLKPMPAGAKFNILALDASYGSAFVHTTELSNTSAHITMLDNALTNGKGDVVVIATQNWGKYNTSPVGMWWTNGKWAIYNENRQPMPIGTKFNVLVLRSDVARKMGTLSATAFKHQVEVTNRPMNHVTSFDQSSTNNNVNATVFTTTRWAGKYDVNPTGVWWNNNKWTVFNQNRAELEPNTNFNVVSFTSGEAANSGVVLNKNVYEAVKYNPSFSIIRPKFDLPNTGGTTPPPPPPPVSNEPQGPKLSGVPHLIKAEVSEDFRQILSKLNLFDELYEDKNPRSNIYYYLPAKYSLKWDKDSKAYSFSIYYLSAGAGERGSVIVTSKLYPNITEEEVVLAEKLLSKSFGKTVKLRSMTMLLKDTPKVNLGSALSNFDVRNESVNITVPSDVFSPIIVSWRMDKRVEDLIGAMMNDQGIAGNITFSPLGDVEKNISVTATMKVNEAQTFGKLQYEDGIELFRELKNPYDYPVTLKNIVVLKNKDGGTNFGVEQIKLNASGSSRPGEIFVVNPLDLLKVGKATNVELTDLVVDRRDSVKKKEIENIWVDYVVDACEPCNLAIQEKVLKGTTSSKIQKIGVEVMNALAFSKAHAIKLQIKSVQGDPNGKSEQTLPTIDIKEDLKSLSGGDLFVPEGSQPAFEYKLYVLMKDGTLLESEWVTYSNLILTIGEAQLKAQFPDLGK